MKRKNWALAIALCLAFPTALYVLGEVVEKGQKNSENLSSHANDRFSEDGRSVDIVAYRSARKIVEKFAKIQGVNFVDSGGSLSLFVAHGDDITDKIMEGILSVREEMEGLRKKVAANRALYPTAGPFINQIDNALDNIERGYNFNPEITASQTNHQSVKTIEYLW